MAVWKPFWTRFLIKFDLRAKPETPKTMSKSQVKSKPKSKRTYSPHRRTSEGATAEYDASRTPSPQLGALYSAGPVFSLGAPVQAKLKGDAPNIPHAGLMLQRLPGNESSSPTPTTTTDEPTAESTSDRTATLGLIVEDSAEEMGPGQMRKSEFLAQLQSAVCSTAEEALSGTPWSAESCPYIERWFGYYRDKSSQYIERAIRRYAPETSGATTARNYIPLITGRVRRTVTTWATTGEVTDVPEDMPTGLPGTGLMEAAGGLLSGVASAGARLMSGVLFKSRNGGQRTASDPQTIQAQLGPGHSLDSHASSRVGSAFGQDFSHVRIHTDAKAEELSNQLNARAFTVGRDVAIRREEYRPGTPVGDALIAHELAHVVQQGGGNSSEPMQEAEVDHGSLEEEADMSAVGAVVSIWGGLKGGAANVARNAVPRLRSGLRLQRCDCNRTPTPTLQDAYSGRVSWTAGLSRQALNNYQGLSSANQATWVNTHYSSGALGLLLRAVPASEIAVGGSYNTTVQSILQRVQRAGAISFAATQGIQSQSAMAQEQANFMHARNVAAAQASAAPGVTLSQAQVAAQQSSQVASTSIAPQTATLSAIDEALHNANATAAVATFVIWVQSNHPGLNITASDFRVDSRAVFDRGQGVIAFADQGKVVVGRPFTLAVNANPAYALPTVIHELRGHEQYGPYGQPGSEYGLELYDLAAALMPGYTQPTARTAEIDAYAYQETEIYSLLLEVPYYTPVAPQHQQLSSINFDPAPAVSARIGIIKNQWEPRVARSLLRGLVLRFRLDPRLTPPARQVFEQGIRNNFTPAEAAAILQ